MSQATPKPDANQGEPLPRIDGRIKVTGEACYPADFPIGNLAYAVLVTGTIARGEVESIELDAARAMPNVLAVISYGDVDELQKPELAKSNYTSVAPLHSRKIWHDGQIIALVIAETFQAAEAAAKKVTAKYREQQPSANLDSLGTETIPAAGNASRLKKDPSTGDFSRAWQDAPIKVDAEYLTPTQTHNPIELFSTTAMWNDDKLTVYEPTQNVHGLRNEIARQLNMDAMNVRVISPYIGGAFGSKGAVTPRTAIVAYAAKQVKRPVRCVVSREQGFTTQPYRAPTRHHVRLGATADGKITAYGHESWELTSRSDNYAVAGTETTSRLYGYATVLTKVNLVKADRQTPSYMRSPPEVPYIFPLESVIDELAYQLNKDPIELRRINDINIEPINGKPFSSRHLMQCYDHGAKAFNWYARDRRPASMRDGEWLIGMGCATAVYPTNVGAATARVRLDVKGKIRVQSCSHEIGTGVRTVAGQMAAERLGVALSAVTVEIGDSELPPAPVSGGSNSTASVCSAVLKACDQIRARLFKAAVNAPSGALKNREINNLDLRDGFVIANDGAKQSLSELFDLLGAGVIEEYAEFLPEGAPHDAIQKLYGGTGTLISGSSEQIKQVRFAFGAEFVEVRIHMRTREIRIPRLLGVFAAGRIMNTRTAHSQLMGGLIWGASSALLESTEFDARAARIVNRDLQDYLVPVNADIEAVDVVMLPEVDEHINPAGVKGVGELGNVGTNAAIANAVFHATGKRIRRLPIRIEDLIA